MFDRHSAILANAGRAVFGLAVLATLVLAGCGSSSSTPTTGSATNTPSGLTSCSISSAQLAPSNQTANK